MSGHVALALAESRRVSWRSAIAETRIKPRNSGSDRDTYTQRDIVNRRSLRRRPVRPTISVLAIQLWMNVAPSEWRVRLFELAYAPRFWTLDRALLLNLLWISSSYFNSSAFSNRESLRFLYNFASNTLFTFSRDHLLTCYIDKTLLLYIEGWKCKTGWTELNFRESVYPYESLVNLSLCRWTYLVEACR